MRIAILDPAAGISGDMTLAALLSLGLPVEWLEELPGRLRVGDVRVTVRDVRRAGIICKQVEFAIPAQPHGRHVGELLRLVEKAPVSDWVKERALRAFLLLGEAEGCVRLGVEAVHHLPVAVGRGWVEAAHGRLPVPAPATAILLEGFEIVGAGGGGGPGAGEAPPP